MNRNSVVVFVFFFFLVRFYKTAKKNWLYTEIKKKTVQSIKTTFLHSNEIFQLKQTYICWHNILYNICSLFLVFAGILYVVLYYIVARYYILQNYITEFEFFIIFSFTVSSWSWYNKKGLFSESYIEGSLITAYFIYLSTPSIHRHSITCIEKCMYTLRLNKNFNIFLCSYVYIYTLTYYFNALYIIICYMYTINITGFYSFKVYLFFFVSFCWKYFW